MPTHATHGRWCGARTYLTLCHYCGADVFYFSCDCGSKVFFDELGGLWPEHECIDYLIVQYGKEFVERALALQMMRPGIPRRYRFDDEYEERITRAVSSLRRHRIVRRDPPSNAKVSGVGVMRELVQRVDLFRKTGLPDTGMGRALLGPLGREPMCQITVHVGSLADDDVGSFTFYAPERVVSSQKLRVGGLVSFRLQSFSIPGKFRVWLAVTLEVPI